MGWQRVIYYPQCLASNRINHFFDVSLCLMVDMPIEFYEPTKRDAVQGSIS